MHAIPYPELYDRFTATSGKLASLRTCSGRRKSRYEVDFHGVGDPFVRDLSVIMSSKAWRRMGGKNQVASSPYTPHIRNRLTHVCEVMSHAGRIADHLGLNVYLTQAIAAGHDIGHVPFGHQGEHYIKTRLGNDFSHEVMGVVVAQQIERRGCGLNLTHETLDGMYRHSGKNVSNTMTQEAWVVRYADKIAYLFADYNDFTRLHWVCNGELKEVIDWFGTNQRERTFRTIVALCEESVSAGKVIFEQSEAAKMFNHLRALMYKEYVRVVEQNVARILDPIFDFLEASKSVPAWLGLSLLTDEEVSRLLRGQRMLSSREVGDTGLGEIIERFDRSVLFSIKFELGLDW